MEKTIGFFCAFFIVASSQTIGACCSSETFVQEIHIPAESISDIEENEVKVQVDGIWLIDIDKVGLYTCLAHRADCCRDEDSCRYLHADEVEYIAFSGKRMHVMKIIDRSEDKDLETELLRAKTPDSYHRTVKRISKMMGDLVTQTPYPVIRVKSKKRRSSHSKSC